MATVNFKLIRRDKTDEKTIQFIYFDKKNSRGTTPSFPKSLKYKALPNCWKKRIDSETKKEKWIIGDSKEAKNLNEFLWELKNRLFKLRDSLVREDKFGKKIFPTATEVKKIYEEVSDSMGMPDLNISKSPREVIVKYGKRNPYDLTLPDLIEDYIKRGGVDGNIEDTTIEILDITKKHALGFESYSGCQLLLTNLSRDCFNMVRDYLLTHEEKGGAGHINSTAKKYLSRMRDVITSYSNIYPQMDKGFLDGTYPKVKEQIKFALYEELEVVKQMDFKSLILQEYLLRFINAPENGESYWTTKELSEIISVAPSTIRKRVKSELLPGVRKKIKNFETYVFDKKDLIQFVKNNELTEYGSALSKKIKRYEQVRDWYCFACEAPLRYSDLKRIDPNVNLIETKDTNGNMIKAIILYPKKTIRHNTRQQFPLSEYCLSIIDKYKDEVPDNMLLPVTQTNSVLNEVLHQILKMSGQFNDNLIVYQGRGKELIATREPRWSELTFHTARHTFGTNMIARNVNPIKIMRALGHAKLTTTQKYMEVIEDDFYFTILNKFKSRPESKLVLLPNSATGYKDSKTYIS